MSTLLLMTTTALMGCSTWADAAPERTAHQAHLGHSSLPSQRVPDGFWDHWGDGRAELAGYRLQIPRYGEVREGRATVVTVTERFTHAQRVKSDGGHRDEYPVLKVNFVKDFQTGIYDYNVMTSAFLRLDGQGAIGEPVKVSMSMQEWCGHVYEQLVPEDGALSWTSHSYFDGEGDRKRDVGRNPGGIVLDALPALVRGLSGPLVGPGESLTAPALTTLVEGRMAHREPRWSSVTLTRDEGTASVTVPAGTFMVHKVTSVVPGSPTTEWFVEDAWPHRLVKWQTSHGEVGELTGADRLAYWGQHNNGDEGLLTNLGHPVPHSLFLRRMGG